MATLKRQHSTDSKCKFVKLQQLFCLFLIARKAMKNSSNKLLFITFQDVYQLILSLPTMYHQWKLRLNCPFYLCFKSQKLL